MGNAGFFLYDYCLRRFRSEISIPKYLQSKDIEVKQLRSYFQRGGSCGWYAIMNAYAIQELVKEQREITSQVIEDIVRIKLIPSIVANDKEVANLVETSELFGPMLLEKEIRLAKYFGLHNYRMLDIFEEKIYEMIPSLSHDQHENQKEFSTYLIHDLKKTIGRDKAQ